MHQKIRLLLLSLILVMLPSCALTGSNSAKNQPVSPEQQALYNKRCEALFRKLRHGVWQGMTSRQFAREMGDASWVDQARISRYTVVGGYVPLDYSLNRGGLWVVHPYCQNELMNYHLWVSLEMKEDLPLEDQTYLAKFMKGQIRDSSVRLHQICLCTPPGFGEGLVDKEERIPEHPSNPYDPFRERLDQGARILSIVR
jgi:hypothetical protein